MKVLYLFDSTSSEIIWPPYHNTLNATQIPTNIGTLFFYVLTEKLKEPANFKKTWTETQVKAKHWQRKIKGSNKSPNITTVKKYVYACSYRKFQASPVSNIKYLTVKPRTGECNVYWNQWLTLTYQTQENFSLQIIPYYSWIHL
jgi:hypothetical protein